MQCNAIWKISSERGNPQNRKRKRRKPAGISHHFLLGILEIFVYPFTHTQDKDGADKVEGVLKFGALFPASSPSAHGNALMISSTRNYIDEEKNCPLRSLTLHYKITRYIRSGLKNKFYSNLN